MEETQSIKKRTFKGKSTILFLLHLFSRGFIVILCPVSLVFTFQKGNILSGEWALNLQEFIFFAIVLVVGGSSFFSLICLIFVPFSSLTMEGPQAVLKRRFSGEEITFDLSGGKNGRDVSVVLVSKKRSFLGEAIVLEDSLVSTRLREVSFPSPVWKELSIYLLGLSSSFSSSSQREGK